LFEGLKAYRKPDGSILLFRPEENALRMQTGAERMCMPAPSVEQFVDAVKQTVLANKRWVGSLLEILGTFLVLFPLLMLMFSLVLEYLLNFQVPPTGKGSLYLRPLLMGSGAVLGLAPAPEYTFIIFVSPVGNYFKVGKVLLDTCFHYFLKIFVLNK
jgi:branched-chain amino acid aminotransferase